MTVIGNYLLRYRLKVLWLRHLLFMQCLLETREEQGLSTHGELYDILMNYDGQDLGDLTCPELPLSPLQIPEYLTGQEYYDRKYRFETCYHNGDCHLAWFV